MFIKAAGFKLLMKDAWSRGILFVSRKGEELLIYGGSWIWWGMIDTIPNKVKAALVELTGEFPESGISFKSGKCADNQYEFTETIPWGMVKTLYQTERVELNDTGVIVKSQHGSLYSLYRNRGNTLMISEKYSEIISNAEIIEEKEINYEGAFVCKLTDVDARCVYWSNGTSMLIVFEVIPDDWRKEFMKKIVDLNIGESRNGVML